MWGTEATKGVIGQRKSVTIVINDDENPGSFSFATSLLNSDTTNPICGTNFNESYIAYNYADFTLFSILIPFFPLIILSFQFLDKTTVLESSPFVLVPIIRSGVAQKPTKVYVSVEVFHFFSLSFFLFC